MMIDNVCLNRKKASTSTWSDVPFDRYLQLRMSVGSDTRLHCAGPQSVICTAAALPNVAFSSAASARFLGDSWNFSSADDTLQVSHAIVFATHSIDLDRQICEGKMVRIACLQVTRPSLEDLSVPPLFPFIG